MRWDEKRLCTYSDIHKTSCTWHQSTSVSRCSLSSFVFRLFQLKMIRHHCLCEFEYTASGIRKTVSLLPYITLDDCVMLVMMARTCMWYNLIFTTAYCTAAIWLRQPWMTHFYLLVIMWMTTQTHQIRVDGGPDVQQRHLSFRSSELPTKEVHVCFISFSCRNR